MIRSILVPLDGSALAESALPEAAAVASACGAEVVLVRVQDSQGSGTPVSSVSWRLARTEACSYLDSLSVKLGALGVRARSVVAEGNAAEEIVRLARDESADLVVLSNHGRSGSSEFRLGSTTQQVLSRVNVSVLVARGDAAAPLGEAVRHRSILVPLDGSQRAQWALLQLLPLARAEGAEVLLVHVMSPAFGGRTPSSAEELELARRMSERDRRLAQGYLQGMKELAAGTGVEVRTLLAESPQVVRTLLQIAGEERVSLIAVSAHGCSGAAPWPYGSVVDRLIHFGTTPLLIFQDLREREARLAGGSMTATALVS